MILSGCAPAPDVIPEQEKPVPSNASPEGYSLNKQALPRPTKTATKTHSGKGLQSELESARKERGISMQRMRRHVLKHDSLDREYFEFTPRTGIAQSTLPTLIFLHGYGGTATGVQAETTNGLNRYAQQNGYRVIYPQGSWFVSKNNLDTEVVTSWNDLGGTHATGPEGPLCTADAPQYPCPPECGSCGRCHWTSCNDDIGFLNKLIDSLKIRRDVDETQVFLSGFSNGSMMAQRLACIASQKLKAVALVGGRLEIGYGCTPSSSLPLLQINGGNDSVVPVTGRTASSKYFYQSAAEVDQRWSEANGCTNTVVRRQFAKVPVNVMACQSRCAGTSKEVTQCLWYQGGHRWPGYPEGHGSNGYCVTSEQKNSISQRELCVPPDVQVDVWGSRVLFEFFNQYRKE